jgi:hypothetical protein
MAASFVPVLNVVQALRDYKKAAEEKDYLGMGLGALGTIPGVGAASHAMLMLPAMLRKASREALELNARVIPTHSTVQREFRTLAGNLPENLRQPSFLVTDRKGLTPFGNDLDEAGKYMDPDWVRDLTFVQKPGALDPKNAVGTIFEHDAATLGARDKYSTLQQRTSDMFTDRDYWSGNRGPRQDQFSSFEAFLRNSNQYIRKAPGAELKLYGNVPLHPNNFAGALLNQTEPNTRLLQQLRDRGLPAQLVDFKSPEAMWDAANWLQQKAIK